MHSQACYQLTIEKIKLQDSKLCDIVCDKHLQLWNLLSCCSHMSYCILKTIMYNISTEKSFLSKIKLASKVKSDCMVYKERCWTEDVGVHIPQFSDMVSEHAYGHISSGRKSGYIRRDRAGHSVQWVLQPGHELSKHDIWISFFSRETRNTGTAWWVFVNFVYGPERGKGISPMEK